ncbi:GntR family transcriptional regulator [Williamsia sp.]|uniref:GntR family transcriptional regulator n=1 Tax=Williamsia sp. TaxID=1872085 RepID=UPI001A26554F|nr:GntR family transcriptional regulator [Williamsia sp.]MBJ7291160.1 GntR family transcriptional regulator [Williamsia sp.]
MPQNARATDALPLSLVDVARDRVRDAILGGSLVPGEKIVEEQLCAELGISRAPLREALKLLAQQGLVVQTPRRGTRVAEWSPTDIRQLFDLRCVLERHAIDIALPLGDVEKQVAPVRSALDDMRSAPDDLQRDDAHRRFHAAVVGLANNRQLDLALEPILLKLQLPMAVNLRTEARKLRRPADGIRRHEVIVEALLTNDPPTVLAALRDHGHLDHLDLNASA